MQPLFDVDKAVQSVGVLKYSIQNPPHFHGWLRLNYQHQLFLKGTLLLLVLNLVVQVLTAIPVRTEVVGLELLAGLGLVVEIGLMLPAQLLSAMGKAALFSLRSTPRGKIL